MLPPIADSHWTRNLQSSVCGAYGKAGNGSGMEVEGKWNGNWKWKLETEMEMRQSLARGIAHAQGRYC